MLDDADLRRLAEMGIDVYLPRGPAAETPSVVGIVDVDTLPPTAESVQQAAVDIAGTPVEVLLLAEAASPLATALLADVARALGFARVRCAQMAAPDESALTDACALVAFGDRQARAAGALLPAQRQREMVWVVCAEPALLAGDAQARRALWSELRRVVRGLAARRGSARR